ncbi:MAG: hypothetical protein QW507_02505 [Candidatus Nanoarchaeia archaeon]|nr:hypothetical protein [Candidatus Haiyanarchaeum thermophilum]MCW1303293.1 hypothetical protein [Candidatus Haiyanarchaeum thermophilum]MCW1303975.1 hypothetical protein [Candidatus Haiyanarchaeum thermophilum]MCW1306452.1 hypothetical protein [Candidatus Haiyanarchaeum thermophilum]MCW1307250.1 hypothetical protein [Candidatus Haiyanarchaeum thermophilum]
MEVGIPIEKKDFQKFVSGKIAELNERLRMLETRVQQLRENQRLLSENLLSKTEELKAMIRDLNFRMEEMKGQVKAMQEAVKAFSKEIENVARVQDIKVLEKYINLLDPTRFLTKDEALRLIRRELGKE